MAFERTFVMIKPDGVKRRLMGEIISRFENKGLYMAQCKVVIPTDETLRMHYAALSEKPFFNSLISYMKTGQVVPMVWEGENAVKIARDLIGATNPLDAARGTVRGDYAMCVGRNIIHGADSLESAKREISIWFGEVAEIQHFDKDILYE